MTFLGLAGEVCVLPQCNLNAPHVLQVCCRAGPSDCGRKALDMLTPVKFLPSAACRGPVAVPWQRRRQPAGAAAFAAGAVRRRQRGPRCAAVAPPAPVTTSCQRHCVTSCGFALKTLKTGLFFLNTYFTSKRKVLIFLQKKYYPPIKLTRPERLVCHRLRRCRCCWKQI